MWSELTLKRWRWLPEGPRNYGCIWAGYSSFPSRVSGLRWQGWKVIAIGLACGVCGLIGLTPVFRDRQSPWLPVRCKLGVETAALLTAPACEQVTIIPAIRRCLEWCVCSEMMRPAFHLELCSLGAVVLSGFSQDPHFTTRSWRSFQSINSGSEGFLF